MKITIRFMRDDTYLVSSSKPISFYDMGIYKELIEIVLFELDNVAGYVCYEAELELKGTSCRDSDTLRFEVLTMKELAA